MHLSPVLVISILILAAIGAGCTGSPAPAPSPVPPAPATLSALALAQSDLPFGFTLVEGREKTLDDVGILARNLGWNGGYGISYALQGQDPGTTTTILQSIAIYPEENIPAIAAMSERQDRAIFNQSANLTLRGLGADSRGFFVSNQQEPGSEPVDNGISPRAAEIIFSKGRIFEVVRMSGPGTDVSVLESLAKKAYAKVP
jgi:hypothetical protein